MGAATPKIHSWARVTFPAGVATIDAQSGHFSGITDNGVGDVTLTHNVNDGLDCAADGSVLTAPAGPLAASGLLSVGWTHLTDFTNQFFVFQEQPAGAASAAADQSFTVVFVMRDLV